MSSSFIQTTYEFLGTVMFYGASLVGMGLILALAGAKLKEMWTILKRENVV